MGNLENIVFDLGVISKEPGVISGMCLGSRGVFSGMCPGTRLNKNRALT